MSYNFETLPSPRQDCGCGEDWCNWCWDIDCQKVSDEELKVLKKNPPIRKSNGAQRSLSPEEAEDAAYDAFCEQRAKEFAEKLSEEDVMIDSIKEIAIGNFEDL